MLRLAGTAGCEREACPNVLVCLVVIMIGVVALVIGVGHTISGVIIVIVVSSPRPRLGRRRLGFWW